jgi:hypothetical protein
MPEATAERFHFDVGFGHVVEFGLAPLAQGCEKALPPFVLGNVLGGPVVVRSPRVDADVADRRRIFDLALGGPVVLEIVPDPLPEAPDDPAHHAGDRDGAKHSEHSDDAPAG